MKAKYVREVSKRFFCKYESLLLIKKNCYLNKNKSTSQFHSFCVISKRNRYVLRQFFLSRIIIKNLVDKIPNLVKILYFWRL